MNSSLKEKGNKKLRAQAVATVIGLCIAAIILLASFILTKLSIGALQKRLMPMLDTALDAANAGDFEKVNEYGMRIISELRRAEPKLKLFLNHRDIMEMMRFAEDLSMLEDGGDRMAYVTDIAGIRTWLEMLEETSDTTLNDIL